jgi:hypothetical protein
VLCWRDRRPERGRTDQAKMHCQVYPRRSWWVDHENICSKYTDLFSEPQLERKDGRNASSVRKGPASLCLRAAVLRLLLCRLSWKETEVVTSTGEEEGNRFDVASDCTVDPLPSTTDLFLLPRLASHEVLAGSPWITGPTYPRETHVVFNS